MEKVPKLKVESGSESETNSDSTGISETFNHVNFSNQGGKLSNDEKISNKAAVNNQEEIIIRKGNETYRFHSMKGAFDKICNSVRL